MIDGTQAEYVRIPYADGSLYKMPAGFDEAALTMVSDILPTGYEAGVLNGHIQPGNSVAIIGAGPVGLAALLTAQFYSPAMIIMIDPDKNRVQAARSLGATHGLSAGDASVAPSVMALTGGRGVDVAIEAVGAVPTFLLCQEIVAAGGTIANIGVHGKSVELHLETLWSRNIHITTRLVDTAAIPMLLQAVESKRLKPELLITHRFGFDEMPRAYETFANAAREKAVKVAISTEKPFQAAKPSILKGALARKPDGKKQFIGETKSIDPNGSIGGDEDSTGGDDADDRDLPSLRNDEVDETARKRDKEERFSMEQRREDDKRREAR
jgi:alcohol dehydrogenase